jgi:hypothetical protein
MHGYGLAFAGRTLSGNSLNDFFFMASIDFLLFQRICRQVIGCAGAVVGRFWL